MKVYFKEIPFDQFTPITAYYALATKGSCILESAPGSGRFSFVGIDPMAKIEGVGNYPEALRTMMEDFPVEIDHPSALYTGAPIGFVTFEKEYFFQIYRSSVIFDHELGKAFLATIGREEEVERLFHKLNRPLLLPDIQLSFGSIEEDVSDEEYCQMVEGAKEFMRRGDVYQVVLSRKFQAKMDGDPFQLYRAVRMKVPAPYLFFFDLEDRAVIGASPEKVISVEGDRIEAAPIAGTCKNGESIEALLKDPKETMEHVMLVDLARNDIGAVSLPGSVQVTEFKKAVKFPSVTHLVSKVVGKLDPQFDRLDAFQAAFPAGTLSGAPKKRAQELLFNMEKKKRGLYGGAILALTRKGDLASCIVIRTAVIQGGMMTVQAGAGIVLDSNPQKEAEETRNKASTLLKVATCF
ncbi:MAG: hypothetical protein A3D96_00350 [Chlamydiae bacterium RIFCSPHIGHO2_12_FULL_44_59]|nr:MAG: hypothetical protein A2796_07495 [Chlamydiae bacterium RIFCSPHIGHO2_01_FULL_44_39]OGN59171.1 MAG: hypothetical protein A3C42_05425 [Chlamydiae bacterium RIFCSPHIGHO2_02_FULL_45_9]OGN60832.1 MAG: hypothetical protein A3D96_00350 [Chlamydiae bacterium RIFCSPHIGHO2_12_FULL_44_59]OGN66708.1 MAG: hypothetical protein A2978_02985 [Chlamydiae bacterium RIFCSPLOWO2_01_FULL_44_52]OGN67358.1 MAG: hypothetical protein A3I67_06180 [Chlamydiae bacterium RIFCSPLOWO2_02_FULL_45_22]OGN70633.1 MAG: hyp